MAPHSSTLAWKIHGRRSLVGCSPWGRKESDTTERLHFHFSLFTFKLFATLWTAACQAFLTLTTSWSLPKFMSIALVMPSSHLRAPVFLPGESQGRGSLVGCRLWGHAESDTTEAT